MTLTWAAVSNATEYHCEEKEADEDDWSDTNLFPHCPISNTSVTISAYPQTSYDFQVRAVREVDGVRYYSGWTYTSIKHWDW